MDKIRAPYNFVPLSDKVFLPPWSAAASHDVPFADGVSGTLEVVVTAETPIFVRGTGDDAASFFRLPDGTFAIPGSALRGMLRNTLEIAAFGKLKQFNDHRYGVRDLQNRDLYLAHMAKIVDGQPTPLVTAGWLRRNADVRDEDHPAILTPCAFAKIEYRMLLTLARERQVAGFDPGRRQSAVDKYRTWANASRAVTVDVEVTRRATARAGWPGDFGRVTALGGAVSGELVFTGQPSPWDPNRLKRAGAGDAKHHDFVFYPQPGKATPLPITKELFADFRFVHSDRGQQGRASEAPNTEWAYWVKEFDAGRPVPVFFLTEPASSGGEPQVRAIGLAMMFRLAYRYRVGQLLRRSQELLDDPRPDLAETLFGHLAPKSNDHTLRGGLAGRVSIGVARAEGKPDAGAPVRAVLGAPKATFYPNYVEQPAAASQARVKRYATMMDDDARLRGWKRYRPQDAILAPRLPERASEKVITTFRPLAVGTVFRARIRLHNVRRVELGALLWSLDFGGAEGVAHTLGMARSLGYGAVRLAVDEACNRVVDMSDAAVDLDPCRREFVDTMEGWCAEARIPKGWQRSLQVFQLLSCATRLPNGSADGRHMMLDHPELRNEFVQAKKDGLALLPAGRHDVWQRTEAPRRVAAPSASADPLAGDRALLQRAYDQGQHAEVLRTWMNEGGPLEAQRREIAQKIVVFVARKLKKDHADVVAWLTGSAAGPPSA